MWIASTEKSTLWILILSDYKSLEQIEFAELFEKLKAHDVTAIDVARELQTTPQAVSMWNKGKRNPRPLALDKLRAMVARICGEPVSGENRLKDAATESDLAMWRRRAKSAERELAELKTTLRRLGSNSKILAAADRETEAALATIRGKQAASHSHG